jgi:UDP-N-acetylmuramyl pentapeptide phosphotransferase/UDP-N-acetylglucosamine-1-phosphate transferase
MVLLSLFALGFALTAALRPLIGPVARALGLRRANYAGVMIPTAAGWVVVVATGSGYLISDFGFRMTHAAREYPDFGVSREFGTVLAVAILLYGGLGWLDDRYGERSVRGLRGHLRAFCREGRVTTGFVKAVGGAAFGLALAAWLKSAEPGVPAPARAAVVLLGGALIALSANTLNLLDLRPLRAIKGFGLHLSLVLLLAVLFVPERLPSLTWLALPAGALAAYAPLEARCRAMLGDTGANALGAAAGLAAVGTLPGPAQFAFLAVLSALHLYAERRSITAALAAHPLLDWLDRWGWTDTAANGT